MEEIYHITYNRSKTRRTILMCENIIVNYLERSRKFQFVQAWEAYVAKGSLNSRSGQERTVASTYSNRYTVVTTLSEPSALKIQRFSAPVVQR